jgi:hypothetical protein
VPPTKGTPGAVGGAMTAASHGHDGQLAGHAEQRAVQLSEGPVADQLRLTIRLERDVVRNLGAYLEYGPLSVRRAAFETVERLHAEHPRWPALEHLSSEASVLESDAELRRDLQRLSPNRSRPEQPDQSANTK